MKSPRSLTGWIAAFWILASFWVVGCESQGPFEEAGEEVDQAVDEAEDVVDEAF